MTLIIPEERHDEEPEILDKIRRGEPIRHFETVRQRKNGSLIDISLTISPIRDAKGRVIGASKIARDITELTRARDRQQLLLREMSHRVKNLFALSSSIVGLSARSARSVQELADAARERLAALARAHSLTFSHGVVESTGQPGDAPVADADDRRPVRRRPRATDHRGSRFRRGHSVAGGGREPRAARSRVRDQRRQIRRPLDRRGDDRCRCSEEGEKLVAALDRARRPDGRPPTGPRRVRRRAVAHRRQRSSAARLIER